MPRLIIAISGHGFGHVAQVAPVLNLLHELMPRLAMIVCSSVSPLHLHSRIHCPFELRASSGDIGMLMSSALDVNVELSRKAYRSFHQDWDNRVTNEGRMLEQLGADMVLSNIGYLSLAAAQRAQIPNIALCSLNWADIYRHYFGNDSIYGQIHHSYANADAFLRATPGMRMDNLPNIIAVSPIAEVGINRRDEINQKLGLPDIEKLVLVSMGGIASRLPLERWTRIRGVRWLVQQSWHVEHPDAIVLESLQMSFSDLLASSDLLICKPGYGSFVESASNGIPVLYVSRNDWPESAYLTDWLSHNGVCREVSREILEEGMLSEVLEGIWNAGRPKKVRPNGIRQVAEFLAEKLGA